MKPKLGRRWLAMFLMVGMAPSFAASPISQTDLTRFTFTEYHMGISARIVSYAPDLESAERAGRAAFARIADIEAKMSDYRADSEVMLLCAKPGESVKISDDLFTVLDRSQRLARETNGAFDITIGPFVQLWRQARKDAKLPTPTAIANAKKLVGYNKIKLDAKTRSARLTTPGMRIDLGGIAKGFAGDEALKAMRKEGIKSALIELGGDIILGDAPPKTAGWKISVPNAASPGYPAEMTLKNCAISTSGDTEQFVIIGRVRYSHVVDPKSGRGLTTRVQASVIAPNGLTSDPLSTVLTIIPEAQRAALLRRYPGTKMFIKVAH